MDKKESHKLYDYEVLCEHILHHIVGKDKFEANEYDKYKVLAVSLRDKLLDKWLATSRK